MILVNNGDLFTPTHVAYCDSSGCACVHLGGFRRCLFVLGRVILCLTNQIKLTCMFVKGVATMMACDCDGSVW